MPVRAVIGAPLYNHADHLPAALDSLLAQTFPDFALILVDDGSTDGTAAIAERYAAADARVTFSRNPERLGMIGSWRRAFELARERHPEAEYFAWGSDHDRWEPRWLEALVTRLDATPKAVLATPHGVRIDDAGEVVRHHKSFDTSGVGDARERVRRAVGGLSAGNMVYGLYRADALERAGVFRHVLSPDRLVLLELAFQGTFEQVPEELWQRRYAGLASIERQKRAFFPNGDAPWYTRAPTWVQHVGAVTWLYAVRGADRREGAQLAFALGRAAATRQAARRTRQTARGLAKRRKALRKRLKPLNRLRARRS